MVLSISGFPSFGEDFWTFIRVRLLGKFDDLFVVCLDVVDSGRGDVASRKRFRHIRDGSPGHVDLSLGATSAAIW